MPRLSSALALTLFAAALVPDPVASAQPAARPPVRICADRAHGQAPLPEPYAAVATKIGATLAVSEAAITSQGLEGCRLLIIRVPLQEITAPERTAIVGFVRAGGSLLLAFDEERRAPLAKTRVNDLIDAFGMSLTADTPYVHNIGGLAKRGVINAGDRELPYSGGRAVEGGTPFAWQLDREGKPAQPFGAFTTVGQTGRVVVLAEAMATLFLGRPDGVRLTGVPNDPSQTVYWGKDSAIFMEELLTWLIG